MRLLLSGLVAASLASSPLLAAECVRPADHAAMDVVALKTKLMVTALACKAGDRYNAFIAKYQPDLRREDKSLDAYFNRSYGRTGVKRHDDYVTQLANSQSNTGVQQGSLYCDQNMPAFDEVMALRSQAELPDYAAGRAGDEPTIGACGEKAVHETAKRHATRHVTRRKS